MTDEVLGDGGAPNLVLVELADQAPQFTERALGTVSARPPKSLAQVASRLSSDGLLSLESSRSLVDVLLNMQFQRRFTARSFDQIANDAACDDRLALTEDQQKRVGGVLHALASDPSVLRVLKATQIEFESPAVVQNIKLISANIPVFNDDVSAIDGALIVHEMHIDHLYDDGAVRTTTYQLRRDDLEQLKAEIARAERKENLLDELLDRSAVFKLELNADED